jgi:hypothetical protein
LRASIDPVVQEIWAQKTCDNQGTLNTGFAMIEAITGRDGDGFGVGQDYLTNMVIFGQHWRPGLFPNTRPTRRPRQSQAPAARTRSEKNMALDLTNEVVVRWNDPDPKYAPLLSSGGITVAWGATANAFRDACSALGIRTVPAGDIQTLELEDVDHATPGVPVAVSTGMWPGVHGGDPNVASATRTLWVDANSFRIACLRALYPGASPILAYLPNTTAGVSPDRVVPFETLELALAEAWAAGGNYILALEPRYGEALLRGEEKAMTAWRSLGQTARWLREHAGLFRQRALPIVTVLVDHEFASAEVANLMFRQSLSPALEPASHPPPPDPLRRTVLVAAGIAPPKPEIAARVLAHAQAGSIVVVDGTAASAWWRGGALELVKSQEDRDFYTLGKGQVVAYHEVGDPGELALDVVDLVTQARRPTRLWNCRGGIALATSAPSSGPVSGRALLHVVNYSSPVDQPVLARIHGTFTGATVLRPEHPPVDVRVAKRGTNSEVAIPELARVAVVVFR